MYLQYYLDEINAETQSRIQILQNALKDAPDGRLTEERHSDKFYLMQDCYSGGRRRKHCLTGDNKLLKQMIRKELNNKEFKYLKSVEAAMKTLSETIIDFDMKKAISEITEKCPHLPEEQILNALGTDCVDEWANADYEKSTFKPEELKQITSKGLKVRSKSEALIAEKLYQFNLPLRYEQVLRFKDFLLVPDFTIRRHDGKLFYWEHMGLTNNKAYLDRQVQKLQQYASMEIVPWDNLIITFDNEDGMIDLRRIEFEIRNKLQV